MPCFLPVPVDGCEAKGHGETARRYQVPIDSREVSCHYEIVSVKSKKQGTKASADSANDAVPVDETVRVPQDLINVTEIKGIDVGKDYKSVLALARHLIKPSELGVRSNFSESGMKTVIGYLPHRFYPILLIILLPQ